MAKFKVTYSSGLVREDEQSDCDTIEQFINCRFGANHPADILPEIELIQLMVVGEAAAGETVETTPKKPKK